MWQAAGTNTFWRVAPSAVKVSCLKPVEQGQGQTSAAYPLEAGVETVPPVGTRGQMRRTWLSLANLHEKILNKHVSPAEEMGGPNRPSIRYVWTVMGLQQR